MSWNADYLVTACQVTLWPDDVSGVVKARGAVLKPSADGFLFVCFLCVCVNPPGRHTDASRVSAGFLSTAAVSHRH